jgi:hypothetical protein
VTGERPCRGRTKRGERCRRVVAAGAVHCHLHPELLPISAAHTAAEINGKVAKTLAEIAGIQSPAWHKAMAELTRSQSIAAAASGKLSWLAGGVPLDDWLTGLGPEDHLEPRFEPRVV